MIASWAAFWPFAFYFAVGLFFVMSLWVIVAGVSDIRFMFADLRRQQECKDADDVS